MTAQPLPLTGERTVPGVPQENYWFRRHEVVYQLLAARCTGRTVLEAGCGAGYGADLLERVATWVIAVDYDERTTGHVARCYPRLPVLRANLVALPLRTGAAQVVVSLQVLEHLWDQPGFLLECHRVLAPGGVMLLSTPNRVTFTPGRDTPLNPFHTKEFDATELAELLRRSGLRLQSMLGVHHGPRLRSLDARHGGSIVDAQLTRSLAGAPWPQTLHEDVAGIACADFELHANDLDASLDLVATAVRA